MAPPRTLRATAIWHKMGKAADWPERGERELHKLLEGGGLTHPLRQYQPEQGWQDDHSA